MLGSDPRRCDVCDWPLAASIDDGCVPGNCSYRAREGTPEHERIVERRRRLAAGWTVEEARRGERDQEAARKVHSSVTEEQAAAGVVSHDEARAIADRYNTSHWYPRTSALRPGEERARYSIPPNPLRDDDIRLHAYIARCERIESLVRPIIESPAIENVRAILDNHRQYHRDLGTHGLGLMSDRPYDSAQREHHREMERVLGLLLEVLS